MKLLGLMTVALALAASAEGRQCFQRIANIQLGANDKGLKDAPFGNPGGISDVSACIAECEKLGCTLFTNDYGIGGNCWFFNGVPATTAMDRPGKVDTFVITPCDSNGLFLYT